MDGSGSPPSYDDPKYRCCCNSVHVTTGAVVIAAMNMVWAGKYLVFSMLQFPWFSERFLFGMCYVFLQVAFAVMLLVGLKRNKSGFILANFVFVVVDSVLLMYMTIHLLFIMSAASAYPFHPVDYPEIVPAWQQPMNWIECCVCIVQAAVRVWFAVVLFRCYDYVKHMKVTSGLYGIPETPPPPYEFDNELANQQELYTISQGPIMEKTELSSEEMPTAPSAPPTTTTTDTTTNNAASKNTTITTTADAKGTVGT